MQQVPRRGTRKRVRAEYAARAHLQVAPMHLRFDRRHVVWLEAVWEELQALLRLLPAGAVGYAIRAGGTLRVCGGVVEGI